MITELTLLSLGIYTYDKIKNKNLYKIKKIFNDTMENNNLQYKIEDDEENEKWYKLIIDLYIDGYKKLLDTKELLESSFGHIVDIEQNENLKTATIYIIKETLSDNYKFVPVKVKPYELYLGKTYIMKDIIANMKELPHCIFTGINSSGKSLCMITALINLIQYNSERDIEIYLSQVSSKKDLRKFKDIKQCHGYAENLQEAYDMFQYLYHVMQKRISIFCSVKDKYIDDIYEWNETFPQRKMRIIYLAMDEFTCYMPDNLDNDKDTEIKTKCLDLLIKLIQQSRCAGIYILTSLQRPDKESFPPRLKAQFNCKVSFKQSNIASSLVVTDSDKAFKLKPKREAIVNADEEYLIKTLYIDNEMIQELLKNHSDIEHKNYYNIRKNQEKTAIILKNIDKKSKNKVKIL